MEEQTLDTAAARRLARTIVSDIAAYNKGEVQDGLEHDDLFEALGDLIAEGRELYESRVHPDLYRHGFYEKALVDFLLKPFGTVPTDIW